MAGQSPGHFVAVCASLLVMGCSASQQGPPGQYAQARDSATQASVSRPALARPQPGEKLPVVPPLRPVPPPVAGALAAGAAAGGQAVVNASQSLDPALKERIEEALAKCADGARSDVMFKYFAGRKPTAEECNEQVDQDSRGEPITRAMQLGVEQHRVALRCAEQKLREIKPGGFSLSPRYRYDSTTGKAEYIPRETVNELLKQGRSAELKGTLEPDVVIHSGAPHQVQAVYDFKFPCVNTDRPSVWRSYSEGRADGIGNQGDLYNKALKVEAARVQPHLGVY